MLRHRRAMESSLEEAFMRRILTHRWLAIAAAGAIALAACSSGATPSPEPSEAPASGAPSEAPSPTPTEMPGTKEFKVGFTSIGFSSTPFLAALDSLRDQGYTIDTPELAESELVTAGTAAGDFAFGSGANNSVMNAISQGANLKVNVARVANEWTLYARNDITECAGLAGRKLAIHSEGAVSTAMVKNYIEENCPGTEPEYVVIPGSENRLAALLADQIDASPLELGDSLVVDNEASDRFSLLASFAEDLPSLQTTSVYVSGDFAEENPGTVYAVVKAVIEQFRLVADDPAYLAEIAVKYAPDSVDAATVDEIAQKYVDLKMFPVNGGLNDDNLTYTAEFFGPDGTGSVDRVLELDEFSDLSFLKEVLNELGVQ